MQVIEVAAGLIKRNNRYLIARRKAGVHLAGFWEFPGGKREAGESLADCLRRELWEELSIQIDSLIRYQIVRHEYSDKVVELHFFHCAIEQGEPVPLGCEEVRWVLPEELTQFTFPPADYAVIQSLQRETLGASR
ncbi:MAG TPA: 8-oxo-dGTP diphosphatase MutT [Nitrospira sp.]|nr:8-oxo-dGTP diphosphatase MutT [Nitrospira sp.]HBR48546.1 8-oxo-dGTP diphosphatase MutT [Nitrospira sp.]